MYFICICICFLCLIWLVNNKRRLSSNKKVYEKNRKRKESSYSESSQSKSKSKSKSKSEEEEEESEDETEKEKKKESQIQNKKKILIKKEENPKQKSYIPNRIVKVRIINTNKKEFNCLIEWKLSSSIMIEQEKFIYTWEYSEEFKQVYPLFLCNYLIDNINFRKVEEGG